MFIDLPALKIALEGQLGKPYKFGAEVRMDDRNPVQFDCSELIEWGYAQIGVKVPDGSYNQYEQSLPVKKIQFGDLAFLKKPNGGPTYHVGLRFNDIYMIEARGNPYNRVMLMPIKDWLSHPNFTGFRRLTAVME